MKGKYSISIVNRDARYKFEVKRNITFVRGDSGTGKTTLFNMIADHTRLGEASGVTISCDRKCIALIDTEWKHQLYNTKDSIVFIDEGFTDIASDDFANAIRESNNYYVIFNRESLPNIPYSVQEIYEIKASGKEHRLARMYKQDKRHITYKGRKPRVKNHELILTEDKKSGFFFFEQYCNKTELVCESAESKTRIFEFLKKHVNDRVLVIADGAAFGSEIDKIMKLNQVQDGRFVICLPESFEWLILKSNIISNDREKTYKVLENTEEYVESSENFSWEQFFTKYLIEVTDNTVFKYTKNKINDVYTSDLNMNKIIKEIPTGPVS